MSTRRAQIQSTAWQLEGRSPDGSPRPSPATSYSSKSPPLPIWAYTYPYGPHSPPSKPESRRCDLSTWSTRQKLLVFVLLCGLLAGGVGLIVHFMRQSQRVENAKPGTDGSKNGLDVHNDFRASFNAEPLTWSKSLETDAAKWAARCKFEHASNSHGQGENLCLGAQDIVSSLLLWPLARLPHDLQRTLPERMHRIMGR